MYIYFVYIFDVPRVLLMINVSTPSLIMCTMSCSSIYLVLIPGRCFLHYMIVPRENAADKAGRRWQTG